MNNGNPAGLLIEFANPRGTAVQLGPVPHLRFEGEALIAGETGELLARHVDHRWVLAEGGSFSRLKCSSPVVVRFHSACEPGSKSFGPYESFSVVDGIAFANHHVVAFCDRQPQDWYSYDTGSHWEALVVEPAQPQADSRPEIYFRAEARS
jgi:hypothetical protein